jgi:putative peptidoglycan lipid II flippase
LGRGARPDRRGRITLGSQPVNPTVGILRRLTERYLPRGALLLAGLTLGTYAVGLLRDRLFARTFGLSHELDTYNAAFVLPELTLDVLIASGLTAPFVPIFLGLKREGARPPEAFGQTILTLAVVAMGISAAVLFVLAPETAALIAPGFGPEQRASYTALFRVMLITPVVFAASIALGEILVAERQFLFYGLAPLLYNGGLVLGTAAFSDRLGIFGPAWGAVIGSVLHLAIRVIGIRRTGFRIRPRFDARTRPVGEFIRLMLPKMASHPIEPVTFLYFTALATTIGTGAVTAVSFARNFQSLPVSLIGIAFSVAAFPTLAAAATAGDRQGFVALVRTSALTIGVLATAAAAALWLFGGLLIRVFLGGGAFGEADAATTTLVLSAFALSIPFESLVYLLSRAIYATRNTVLAVLANLAGFLVTVGAGFALSATLGIVAIPVAFAVGSAVKVALLAIALVPRLRAIDADLARGAANAED